MKYKQLMIACSSMLLCLLVSVSFAEEIEAPIGKWVSEKTDPTGEVTKVKMEIERNNEFNGVVLVNNSLYWIYSGAWRVKGNKFTYIYKESSKPLPKNFEDTDIILSVDENYYNYKSMLSGKVGSYVRVK